MANSLLFDALFKADSGRLVEFIDLNAPVKVIAELRFTPNDGWQFSSPRTGSHYVRDDGTVSARHRAAEHFRGFLEKNDWRPDKDFQLVEGAEKVSYLRSKRPDQETPSGTAHRNSIDKHRQASRTEYLLPIVQGTSRLTRATEYLRLVGVFCLVGYAVSQLDVTWGNAVIVGMSGLFLFVAGIAIELLLLKK